jgi:post-segregation antitoxin (ccd killing protein)
MSNPMGPRRASARPAPRAALGRASAEPAQAAKTAGSLRRAGHAAKISVTVDADVLKEVRRLIRKTGLSLSAHITEALERDLRQRRLQQIIEAYEAEDGAISEDELAEVRAAWRA